MSEDRHTKYRHTSKILQIRFQTTTIKWVLQENELQSFCWWRSSLQFINNATLVKHNKAKSNKTYGYSWKLVILNLGASSSDIYRICIDSGLCRKCFQMSAQHFTNKHLSTWYYFRGTRYLLLWKCQHFVITRIHLDNGLLCTHGKEWGRLLCVRWKDLQCILIREASMV